MSSPSPSAPMDGRAGPHRRAAILAIGDELALGQRPDTNSAWLADRLTGHSVTVVEHVTLPDDRPRLVATLRRLAGEADLVIATGGLGPTADDLTRHALADVLGEPLEEDPDALRALHAWFAARGVDMPEGNRVQALCPPSARLLPNPHGTAGGILATTRDGADIVCLPGPPREMRPMFDDHVAPMIRLPAGRIVRTRLLRSFGLGESHVAALLADLMHRDRTPLVGTTVSRNVVSIRLRYEGEGDASVADARLEQDVAAIRDRLGPAVFDPLPGDEDDPIAHRAAERLAERLHTLVVAESCTGGNIGSIMTSLPGSSNVFVGGFITYSNESKTRELGVPEHLIRQHGAVSAEVCRAMLEGALRKVPADHALAVTGIAGPAGGTPEKPVGTVWIGLASRRGLDPSWDRPDLRRFRFAGGRQAVRDWAARMALGMLRLRLIGKDMDLLGQQERPGNA